MRKKLFAVIMSAMMMITFMPSMAFAASITYTEVQWDTDNYSWVKLDGTKYTNIVKTYDSTTGQMKATLDIGDVTPTVSACYYDFSMATITSVGTNSIKNGAYTAETLFGTSITDTTGYFDNTKLTQDVALSFTDGKADPFEVTVTQLNTDGFTVVVDTPKYDFDNKYQDQTFTLNAKVTNIRDDNTDGTKVGFVGKPSTAKEIKAIAFAPAPTTAALLLDGKAIPASVYYDGAEHVYKYPDMSGVTFDYKQYDSTTGKWATVDGFKVKDVVATAPSRKASYTKGAVVDAALTPTGIVEVAAALTPSFAFKTPTAPATFVQVGENFEIMDYLENTVDLTDTTDLQKVATKKALAADKELFTEYFNDFYEITEVEGNDGVMTATLSKKDLTALSVDEKYALIAKYNQLHLNYGAAALDTTLTPAFITIDGTANVFTYKVVNNAENDLTFVKGPLSKTFKAKKGKLAKNRTFYVKAEAESKVAPTYKISYKGKKIVINKKTGKVTCKKGLKKGTYKVKIIAKVAAGKGYMSATESYTAKIIIK